MSNATAEQTTTENAQTTGFLDRAVAASVSRYGAESRDATRPQLRSVLRVAHNLPQDSQERITLFGFLKGGMSKKGASRILTIAKSRLVTYADLVSEPVPA